MNLTKHLKLPGQSVLLILGLGLLLAAILLYKLGSLMSGLSSGEISAATTPVGLHGIYHHPQYLPLELVRSIDFTIFKSHGQTLTRLPNTLFGALAIINFAWVIKQWHSPRTAVLATVLFATAAWTLHVSRLASFDVMYLWAMPTLILSYSLLQRHSDSKLVWYACLVSWLFMIYIPGLIWLLLASLYLERQALRKALVDFSGWWQRVSYAAMVVIGLPLLVVDLLRPHRLAGWLGLPSHFPGLGTVIKHFVAVPVHLFIRGPQYPTLWLGRAPLMDIFSLVLCLIGIYFYATHLQAARSRLLLAFALISFVLVGLNGPVSFSLIVPLMYVSAATGIAYLLHEWLQTFPRNPLARSLGIGIIVLAVVLSASYNLRAYFLAWPHNVISQSVFRYHR